MDFKRSILNWYFENKRALPWRETKDPYLIWVSEIILQQTRVVKGKSYYEKFISTYPTISKLSEAPEEDILKLWQGLGYYSRARNMLYAAKFICENHDGEFPKEHNQILELKGVGVYTAAAICSFAFNQPFPVIDGNVYRVLSRFYGIHTPIDSHQGKKEYAKLAEKVMCTEDPANYNQAIMDFGAIQCKPIGAECLKCPLKSGCYSHNHNCTKLLPIKERRIKIRNRFFNYFVIIENANSYITKRTKNDIWKNLYEFPLLESNNKLSKNQTIKLISQKAPWLNSCTIKIVKAVQLEHQLSHQKIISIFWELETTIPNFNLKSSQLIKINLSKINDYPLHRLTEKYLETTHLNSSLF